MATFLKVELAKTGTFNASTGKVTFTLEDFNEAERAYLALRKSFDAPIKLGHDDDQEFLQEDGLPSAGWLRNIHRSGNKLIADLVDVPEKIAALVRSGLLRKRSIEAVRNFEAEGKRWPFVITGLAFLGADLPAVTGLADIASLYASLGLEEQEVDDEATAIYVYQSKQIKAAEAASEGDPTMNEKLMKLARTMLKLAADADLSAVLAALKLEAGADEDAVYAALGSYSPPEPDPTADELAAAAAEKAKAEAAAAAVLASKSDVEKLRIEVVELQTARDTDHAETRVDEAILAGRFAPATREHMIKLALDSPEAFASMVEAAPKGTVIPKGEEGTSGGSETEDEILEEFKPTADAREFLKGEGLSEDAYVTERIRAAGKEIPKALAERNAKVAEERIKAAREAITV